MKEKIKAAIEIAITQLHSAVEAGAHEAALTYSAIIEALQRLLREY